VDRKGLAGRGCRRWSRLQVRQGFPQEQGERKGDGQGSYNRPAVTLLSGYV